MISLSWAAFLAAMSAWNVQVYADSGYLINLLAAVVSGVVALAFLLRAVTE